MKQLFKSFLIIFVILFLIYYWFLYIDIKEKCVFVLVPTFQPSNLSTKETINFLKESSAEEYKNLCIHVSAINKNPACGGFDGGCYEPNKTRTIYVGNDQNNIALAAAILVHETCHAIQGQKGLPLAEGECYAAGSHYLNSITDLY
ncbi:hypothetical protein C4561_02250 [candidate division WWE3 bacterium]|jgi:hypothetical protein|uniref:Uncharacterized protein n=1 Tax=candidate division WWE3 bacterium TaxID=2053526 RepID=A0A3A4ZDS6_UNCKA|nr:MAG: hypothetical protein C4561_02250 [candidate division WWE3 bacterium]